MWWGRYVITNKSKPTRYILLDVYIVVYTYHCEVAGTDTERANQLFNHRFLIANSTCNILPHVHTPHGQLNVLGY